MPVLLLLLLRATAPAVRSEAFSCAREGNGGVAAMRFGYGVVWNEVYHVLPSRQRIRLFVCSSGGVCHTNIFPVFLQCVGRGGAAVVFMSSL